MVSTRRRSGCWNRLGSMARADRRKRRCRVREKRCRRSNHHTPRTVLHHRHTRCRTRFNEDSLDVLARIGTVSSDSKRTFRKTAMGPLYSPVSPRLSRPFRANDRDDGRLAPTSAPTVCGWGEVKPDRLPGCVRTGLRPSDRLGASGRPPELRRSHLGTRP